MITIKHYIKRVYANTIEPMLKGKAMAENEWKESVDKAKQDLSKEISTEAVKKY